MNVDEIYEELLEIEERAMRIISLINRNKEKQETVRRSLRVIDPIKESGEQFRLKARNMKGKKKK